MANSDEYVHELACWFAKQAANMVFLQSERLFGPDADLQTANYDFWFLLTAANQLRKATALVARSAKDSEPIEKAIKRLDECIPDLEMARNILMHFDDYIAGDGRQREKAETAGISPSSLSLFEFRRSSHTIIWSPMKAVIGNSQGGFRVDVAQLEECVQNIREAICKSQACSGT
jgi:hypothetical protein